MALNKFLVSEIVNISDGNTAIVKNYYPANNFVILYAHSNNDIGSIKAGMTITGQSSGFSKTLTEWKYSTPENGDLYDLGFNTYDWQEYVDKIIVTETDLIVTDEIYNMYPHNTLDSYAQYGFNYEILDFQFNEGIVLD